ncbi:Organic hydroperoxide resistance protein [Minicystis rosea]|nr:Organic hydroperoxide resistance protein [Minicystis rosea]
MLEFELEPSGPDAIGEKVMTKMEKILYTARTHTTRGRDGTARSDDGRLDVQLTPPGAPGNGTNPEQLFAAGWSACFMGAIQHVAATQKIALPKELAVDAEVDLGLAQDGFQLRARLHVSLPGLDAQTARSLVEAAHQTCPYSKATRGNIDVSLSVG